MMYSRKLVGSIKSYMTIFISTIFISAAIVALLLFILCIMPPNITNAYASSSSSDSKLTVLESGKAPSNIDDRLGWEYTIYHVDNINAKIGGYYYIEYYNPRTGDVELMQFIN